MMTTTENLLFNLGLALFFSHELDAVRQREWRLLFVLRHMPEHTAARAFIAIHVPFFLILLVATETSSELRFWSRAAISAFLVVHAGLHWSLRDRTECDFNSGLSRGLIYGAAFVGVLHILVAFVTPH
jgi:hypothetical protein